MRIGLVLGLAGWIVAAMFLWRTSVPSLRLGGLDPHAYFSARVLARAREYGNGERALWLLTTAASLATLGILVWRLPRSARGLGLGRVGSAIVLGMVAVSALWFVHLPFSIAGLWWQHHYGLGPFDPGSWLAAQWSALSAQAVFALAAIALVVALAVRFPRGWWLPGAAVFVALTALLGFVSGWLAAAGTHPPRSATLRADVVRIEGIERVHPPVAVMNVSSWTSEPNAFTAGFGPSTHVVVWNTLLDGRFSRSEIDFVIAHELGHARSRHILKDVGWYALFVFPAALLIAGVTQRRGGLRNPANLPLALLVLTVFGLAVAPFQNAVSRRYEAEADWRALEATHDPAAARALFRQFVPTTLSEPDPPGWDYAWLENHPTGAQRLAMVNAFAKRAG
jgi:Zn-dependent protease with chaperone function